MNKLSVVQAALKLGVSKSWLDKKRVTGGGPPYMKFGRRVLYDAGDLEMWANGRRKHSTSSF